jgi:hypothetical protein
MTVAAVGFVMEGTGTAAPIPPRKEIWSKGLGCGDHSATDGVPGVLLMRSSQGINMNLLPVSRTHRPTR